MRTALLASALVLAARVVLAADVPADPSNYRARFARLAPGDTLRIAGGDYTQGLRVQGVHGAPGAPITVEGPSSGAPARFLARAGANTIDLENASYVTLRNLHFDGRNLPGIDAIKAGGDARSFTHHITIEGCAITGHDGGKTSQQTVGINTKIVSWDWVVRGNVIDGAGTGMYLGDSDGTRGFFGGVIEGNVFRQVLGCDLLVKHQIDRGQAHVPNVPTDPRVTIVRDNVFLKTDDPSPDGVRPNVRVGGFPDSGPGSDDRYEIYGNFFAHNPRESLLEATGRVHVHHNVFVAARESAVLFIASHGKPVIDAIAYSNTIYWTGQGIRIADAPRGRHFVGFNAILADDQFNFATAVR